MILKVLSSLNDFMILDEFKNMDSISNKKFWLKKKKQLLHQELRMHTAIILPHSY